MDIIHDKIEIVSFGYGHGPTPAAHAVLDVRHHFRDPHANLALRHLTAEHPAVMQAVMGTPGVPELVRTIADLVYAFRHGPQPGLITIAVGCAGGRHRSAAIAIEAAAALEAEGFSVTLTHRDLGKPVIDRPASGPVWRTSSYSSGGACVQIAGLIPVGPDNACQYCGDGTLTDGATCPVCSGNGSH